MILLEPDPRLLPRLRAHLASMPTGAAPRVSLIGKGASDRSGRFSLQLGGILGQSKLAVNGAPPPPGSQSSVEIETVRLDETLRALRVERVRLMKMDVEGHEIEALAGLGVYLAERRIDVVAIERNRILLEEKWLAPRHLYAMLGVHGFSGFRQDTNTAITPGDIDAREPWVENWQFASSAELCAELGFRGSNGFATEFLEEAAREAFDPEAPGRRKMRAISAACGGNLAAAIDEARAILAEDPGDLCFRGHLAWWLLSAGRRPEAVAEYDAILAKRPEDPEAKRLRDLAATRRC